VRGRKEASRRSERAMPRTLVARRALNGWPWCAPGGHRALDIALHPGRGSTGCLWSHRHGERLLGATRGRRTGLGGRRRSRRPRRRHPRTTRSRQPCDPDSLRRHRSFLESQSRLRDRPAPRRGCLLVFDHRRPRRRRRRSASLERTPALAVVVTFRKPARFPDSRFRFLRAAERIRGNARRIRFHILRALLERRRRAQPDLAGRIGVRRRGVPFRDFWRAGPRRLRERTAHGQHLRRERRPRRLQGSRAEARRRRRKARRSSSCGPAAPSAILARQRAGGSMLRSRPPPTGSRSPGTATAPCSVPSRTAAPRFKRVDRGWQRWGAARAAGTRRLRGSPRVLPRTSSSSGRAALTP